MAKKKYLYDVTVEDYSMMDTIRGIPANSFEEAKKIAKVRFMRRYWKPKKLKAYMDDKRENF